MTRILYIPREIEYDQLQRVKLKVFNYNRTPTIVYEFCVERQRTTYLFLMNFIVLRTKISAHCFTVKLNGWNEIYNLRQNIPDRRVLSIYFILKSRFHCVY